MSVKASRFSCLPDDDDDVNKKKLLNFSKKNNANGEEKSSKSNENVDEKAKNKNKNKKKKKKNDTNDSKDLQALAYGKKVDQNNLKRDRASSSLSAASEVNDEDFAKWVSQDQMVR